MPAHLVSLAGLAHLRVCHNHRMLAGHVSFFWNGNRGQPFNSLESWHEVWIHPDWNAPYNEMHKCRNCYPQARTATQVPSDQNIPFNEKPEMKSREITDLGKQVETQSLSCSSALDSSLKQAGVLQALRSGKYDGGEVRLNFPNAGIASATPSTFCGSGGVRLTG